MSKSGGGFFSGLIFGGLVGAAVGLLLAPGAGEETRLLLRERSQEMQRKAQATVEQTRTRAQEVAEQTRTRAQEVADLTRTRVTELSEQAKTRAAELQERGREVFDENRERVARTAEAVKRSAAESWQQPTTGSPGAAPSMGTGVAVEPGRTTGVPGGTGMVGDDTPNLGRGIGNAAEAGTLGDETEGNPPTTPPPGM